MKTLSRTIVLWLAVLVAALPAVAAGEVLSADAASRLVKSGEIILVDVRSPAEWRQTGIPAGGKAVTIHDPDGMQGFLHRMLDTVGGDRTKPVALICARGNRSSRAYEFLKSNGFEKLYNVQEGMLGRGRTPGWLARGLPTKRCPKC